MQSKSTQIFNQDKRDTAFLTSSIAILISCKEVNLPKLKRMDECALASERPMAFNTCEGSTVADEHAAPEETDTCLESILINLSPPCMLKQILATCENDWSLFPFHSTPSIVPISFQNKSRNSCKRFVSASIIA